MKDPESQEFKTPGYAYPALYRCIIPNDYTLNNCKSTAKVIAFATNIDGAHIFYKTLGTDKRYVIVKKKFIARDFLLDFSGLYDSLGFDDEQYLGEEFEVWMKSTKYYQTVSQDENNNVW